MKPKIKDLGEHLRFLAFSDSKSDEAYMVDLLQNKCSCLDWQCRKHKQRKDCKHLERAKLFLANRILIQIRMQMLKKYGRKAKED